ncbi:Cts1p [Malassezia vespertilionis]|uniref:chitinase n=1 Tax=Malassezia vespertilionis TaxID=2020962 RepID=A0A2N1J981_9BASI|nr:Cts1p [Malassezia vespertilionis]
MTFHLPGILHKRRSTNQAPGNGKRGYKPSDVPVEQLTHILYAFANIDPDTGTVFLSDKWADQEIKYGGDTDQGPDQLYGNLKQVLLYKQQHRHLKTLLSIGGWSYSSNFKCLSDATKRARFAESAVRLLADYGFDGLDVDWEYPESKDQARIYVALLKEVRHGLDAYGAHTTPDHPHYLLTIAAPCSPAKYRILDIKAMDAYLDYWNLMAYDFSGSWDSAANHQANLYGTPLSCAASVKYYASNGTHNSKLVLGAPAYGRGFDGTQGPGHSFTSIPPGSLEHGVFAYWELPIQGAKEHYDKKAGAAWSYDSANAQLISYDSPSAAKAKVEYIAEKGLAGAMLWELAGDQPATNPRSL